MENVRELDIGQVQVSEKTRAMYTLHAHRENEAKLGRLRYLTKLTAKEAAAVAALRELIATSCGYDDAVDKEKRALVCTPCAGDYGAITSWLIAVEGSPPRGRLLIESLTSNSATNPRMFMLDEGKARRLGSRQFKTVCQFIVVVLGGIEPRMIENVQPVIIAEHMK